MTLHFDLIMTIDLRSPSTYEFCAAELRLHQPGDWEENGCCGHWRCWHCGWSCFTGCDEVR